MDFTINGKRTYLLRNKLTDKKPLIDEKNTRDSGTFWDNENLCNNIHIVDFFLPVFLYLHSNIK